MKNKYKKRMLPKQKWKDIGNLLFFIFLFPYIFSMLFHGIEPVEKKAKEEGIKITMEQSSGLETIPLEEYLEGALAAAIPIEYEEETLKAQAIILRTNIIKKYKESGRTDRTLAGEVIHYSYLNIPERKKLWGAEFAANCGKMKSAVEGTRGMILTYKSYPIEAPFFLISAGKTRMGEEILGKEYPYLVTVDCSRDILAQDYQQKKYVTQNEMKKALGKELNVEELKKIEIKKRDSAGYVLEVLIGEDILNGEEFRQKMGLQSSNFTMEWIDSKICITSNGIGHGIGMSQYGANQQAMEGKSFFDILPYYYYDTQIEKQ